MTSDRRRLCPFLARPPSCCPTHHSPCPVGSFRVTQAAVVENVEEASQNPTQRPQHHLQHLKEAEIPKERAPRFLGPGAALCPHASGSFVALPFQVPPAGTTNHVKEKEGGGKEEGEPAHAGSGWGEGGSGLHCRRL